MNLFFLFLGGLVVFYLSALVYNQGRVQEDCIRSWHPLVLWVVVFFVMAGMYYILLVPKKGPAIDVRDIAAKQGQKMLPPPAVNHSAPAKAEESKLSGRIAPSGVVVVNETNDDVVVEGITSTRVVKAHTSHSIGCMSADGTRLKIKGEEYDFRFGGQSWWKATITSGGVTSEPLS